MKQRILILCLVGILILCAGCSGKSGQGTNASTAPADSSPTTKAPAGTLAPDTVPETADTAPSLPPQTEAPVTEAPVTDAPATEAPVTEPPATDAPTEPAGAVDPWSLLGELSFDQGSYTDEYGYNITWSYGLPALLADTEDAKAINADIDSYFGDMIRTAKQSIEEGHTVSLLSTGYYGKVWQDVLTIVVIAHWDFDYTDYAVYCYDCSTGRALDTPALLEKKGISSEAFLSACESAFTSYFEDMYSALPEEYRQDAFYYEQLARQGSPEYVNLELMAYPDENGDITVIAPIVSLAGADHYYHEIPLGLVGN